MTDDAARAARLEAQNFDKVAEDIAGKREVFGRDNYAALIDSRLRDAYLAGEAAQAAEIAQLRAERKGWTCFHCGETFTTPGAAGDHFGARPEAQAGCLIDRVALEVGGTPECGRGLLMALRKCEADLATRTREVEHLRAEKEADGEHWQQAENELAMEQSKVEGLQQELAALHTALTQVVERWRISAEDCKDRGYLETWNERHSCATELEAALVTPALQTRTRKRRR